MPSLAWKGSRRGLKSLGYHLDGWSDVIPNAGNRALEVRERVYQILGTRYMPDVKLSKVWGFTNLIGQNTDRPYIIATTHPAATVYVYVEQHGADLYVSWRSFIKNKFRWWVKALALLALIGVSALTILSALSSGGATASSASGTNLSPFLTTICGGGMVFCCSLSGLLTIGIPILMLMAIAGYYLQGNIFYYLFYDPTIFDVEDVNAMQLTVDKTLREALRGVGIDPAFLRVKEGGFKPKQGITS